MTRKRASFLSRHPEERNPTLYPRCNATDNRTSPLRQRFGDEREERRGEEESIQARTPSGLPSSREPRPLPPARSEQQPGQEPEQITKLVELAESHLAAGETRQAVVLLEEAVARNSHDLRLLLLLGKAREAQGDYRGAVDAYLSTVERGGWDPAVEAVLLRDDFLLQTYPYLADLLLRLTARPYSVPLWRRVARLCEAQGDSVKATRLLAEAIRVKPDDVASLSILARIAEHEQQGAEAAKWHRRILEIRPDLRASLLFLAQSHYAKAEYEEALPYFERLLAQERGDRSCELYWLLSAVKSSGVQGLEERIGEVMRWQEFKTEERPLAQELFVVVGEDSLRNQNLERAEHYLSQAYQLAPSREAGRLLAEVISKKGERAQREGHLLHACVNYQRAAEYDPDNPTYTQQVAQAVALRAAERQQRLGQKYQRVGIGAALVLLLVGGILGVRHVWEKQGAPAVEENGPTTVAQGQPMAVQDKAVSLPAGESTDSPQPLTEPEVSSGGIGEEQLQASPAGRQRDDREMNAAAEESNQSRVETAMALGMLVSGTGRRDPARFPMALREEVEKHRADLQAVYDRERATNPTLMGSVVLGLTIEPNGRVSQARVQAAKLPNPRLSERVLSLARAWQFAPAAGRVSVSYPLLFLPPRVDMASVIAWERNTAAGRSTVSAPAPVPAADMEPSPAHTPIEQAEARQRSTGSNTPERSNDTAKALAVAEPEREEGHEAPPGSGQRFVHPESGYSITPPPGFTLLQTGQRTIWQGPEGTQLLVETTSTPGRSARAGWEELHAALVKRYGSRYRSYGITETQLAGRPAAAWEFLLTTAAGTRHKLDVAVLDGGVGYGILVSAPAGRFAAWRPQFEGSLRSFGLPRG